MNRILKTLCFTSVLALLGGTAQATALAQEHTQPTSTVYRCSLKGLGGEIRGGGDVPGEGLIRVPPAVNSMEQLGLELNASSNTAAFVYFIHTPKPQELFALLQIRLNGKVVAEQRYPIATDDARRFLGAYADADNDGIDDFSLHCWTIARL